MLAVKRQDGAFRFICFKTNWGKLCHDIRSVQIVGKPPEALQRFDVSVRTYTHPISKFQVSVTNIPCICMLPFRKTSAFLWTRIKQLQHPQAFCFHLGAIHAAAEIQAWQPKEVGNASYWTPSLDRVNPFMEVNNNFHGLGRVQRNAAEELSVFFWLNLYLCFEP